MKLRINSRIICPRAIWTPKIPCTITTTTIQYISHMHRFNLCALQFVVYTILHSNIPTSINSKRGKTYTVKLEYRADTLQNCRMNRKIWFLIQTTITLHIPNTHRSKLTGSQIVAYTSVVLYRKMKPTFLFSQAFSHGILNIIRHWYYWTSLLSKQ